MTVNDAIATLEKISKAWAKIYKGSMPRECNLIPPNIHSTELKPLEHSIRESSIQ